MTDDVLARATALYRARFGAEPRWGYAAPGRINLIGEHTDYNGGLVLPIAIDRVCVAVAGPGSGSGMVHTVAESDGAEAEFACNRAIDPEETRCAFPSWARYVAGVVEMIRQRAGGNFPALDLAIASSVPIGAGLSSSASLEVAVASVLSQAAGLRIDPYTLAHLCQQAEHEFAGVPCGIMDQFSAVHGREDHALLIDCRTEAVEWLPMPPGVIVVVMNSGVRHELATGEYAARRRACDEAVAVLGVNSLRDADESLIRRAGDRLSDEQHRCATHVVTENARTAAAASLLRDLATGRIGLPDSLRELGRLMADSHRSLRADYRVSCPELDLLVDTAATTPGVHAARMTGAGFGGCAIALADAGILPDLVARLDRAYRARFGRPCEVFATRASAGAGPVDPAHDSGSIGTL